MLSTILALHNLMYSLSLDIKKKNSFIESVEGLPLPAHKSTLFIQPHDPKK